MEHFANVKELNQSSARDKAARAVFTASAFFSVVAVAGIVFFIMLESLPAFSEIGALNFIFGTTWAPTKDFLPVSERFGILPMIVGSLVVTAGATLVGGTMGVFTAVFLAYFCPKRLKAVFNQVINLLAGIPSIVYGYFGLVVLVPLLAEVSPTNSGQGALAGSLILGIMILPTVASIVRNSIESVPEAYFEGALALGCSREQAVFKTVLPAAKSGTVTGVIMGIGRAVGETNGGHDGCGKHAAVYRRAVYKHKDAYCKYRHGYELCRRTAFAGSDCYGVRAACARVAFKRTDCRNQPQKKAP